MISIHRGCFVILAAALFLLGSCCDRESPRVDDYYNFESEYELALKSVTSNGNIIAIPEPLGREVPVTIQCADLSVVAQYNRFWLSIKSRCEFPFAIKWESARFEDELGRRHPVYHHPLGRGIRIPPEAQSETQVLDPGIELSEVVAPVHKTYYVAIECNGSALFKEPLVPQTLEGGREQSAEAVRESYAVGRPVALLLPVRMADDTLELRFEYVLRSR